MTRDKNLAGSAARERPRRVALLKLKSSNLAGVRHHGKYALSRRMNLNPGDLILFALTRGSLEPGEKPIQYAMTFRRIYADDSSESEAIWGKRWNFIVEGDRCFELCTPFDLNQVQVSGKTYGQIGPAYVADEDIEVLEKGGYLQPRRTSH